MPEADLALLREAAIEAARIADHYFRKDPEVRDKGDGQGPVTEADLAINAMLERELRAARPDYGWLSEESADEPERLQASRVFVVDPIDGTRAFIDGKQTFSHALAIVENGRAVSAVVNLGQKDMLFEARVGAGALLNGAPIRVATGSEADGARVLATRPNLEPGHWPGGVPAFERHFRPSLAYRLCLVANGAFDGMLTLRNAWEWDIAAGALIVTEAGGLATDRHGAELRFNNAHPQTAGVVAAPGLLHGDILSRL